MYSVISKCMAMGFELLHQTESIVVVLHKKCNFLPICDPWCNTRCTCSPFDSFVGKQSADYRLHICTY